MAGYVAKAMIGSKASSVKESMGFSDKKKGFFDEDDEDPEKKARNKKKAESERQKEEQAEAAKRHRRDEQRAAKHADRAKTRNDIRAKYGLKQEPGAAPSASPPPRADGDGDVAGRRGSQSGDSGEKDGEKCCIM